MKLLLCLCSRYRATLVVALGAAGIVAAAGAPWLAAQQWPNYDTVENQRCTPNGTACAACPNQFGCTSQVPAQWNAGNCQGPAQGNCNWTLFDCGPAYNCNTGLPTGNNCPKPNICQ